MADEEKQSVISAIASRFEKPNQSDGPAAKITDIASRFQGSTNTSTPLKPSATSTSTASGAAAIAARNAPVKDTPDDEVPKKSVADVAARFRSAEKTAAEPTENAFSAAKGAFLKAEAVRTTADVETKVKAAASVFGDTVGNTKKPSSIAAHKTVKATDEEPKVTRVSTEKGPGVAAAAELFQNNAASGKDGDDGEAEPTGSERFANAAKMFGGK